MKLFFYLSISAIVLASAIFLLFGRKQDLKLSETTSIKIGVISGPENELMEKIKEVAKTEQGLDLTIVTFNDYMTPNVALDDKSIDANAFQHEPYLEETVKSRGFKLSPVGKTFIYPLAAYSKKITAISEIAPGAKVAIPNDPTNEARALLLLHNQGLIKLKDPKNLLSLPTDIIENPLGLQIIELEGPQLPRALDDVTLAIINTTFASVAGLNPSKDSIFREGTDSLFVNIVAVRTEDKDAVWVEKLMKAIQNDQIAKAAEDIFSGASIPGWKTE